MNKQQLIHYLREEVRKTVAEGLEGRILDVDHRKARSEEEAVELEKQGYMRIDKRKPPFNYQDEKGSYIPMFKKIA